MTRHYDFDALLDSYASGDAPEPITFTLAGRKFDVSMDPSLGDVMDLRLSPDVDIEKEWDFDNLTQDQVTWVWVMQRFIQRMLPGSQRPTFIEGLYEIPARKAGVIKDVVRMLLDEVISKRPTEGSENSVSGPETTPESSNAPTDGTEATSSDAPPEKD